MKKFSKVMLLIAAVLAAVGIGLSAAGAALGAGDQSMEAMEILRNRFGAAVDFFYNERWSEDGDYEETYDDASDGESDGEKRLQGTGGGDSRIYQSADMESLDIQLKYDELILEAYEGKGIRVEVQNDPVNLIHVKESGKTLKITSARKLEKKRKVLVSYPKDMKFRKVELGIGAGSMEIKDSLTAESLEVNVETGEFKNSGAIKASKTDLEVGVGTLKVIGLKTEELKGQCGVGELAVEVDGKEADYRYRLECEIGELTIGDEDYSGIGKKYDIDNPGASGEIDLECGIGSVSVTFNGR